MRILFLAVNARYIHRSLALELMQAVCVQQGHETALYQATISQSPRDILLRSDFESFDMVCFSAYIWNDALVRELASDMKKIKPQILLLAGGPEAYTNLERYLPLFDGVVMGDGQAPLMSVLTHPHTPALWSHVSRAGYTAPMYIETDLDRWPSPRSWSEDQIIYYESSRGCPYRCSYCLSAGVPLNLKSLPRVREDLAALLRQDLRLLKLVDRSFNADLRRAMKIIDMITELDNGKTTVHLELTPTQLSPTLIEKLSSVRDGLFRYEIGIQSTSDLVNRRAARHFSASSFWPALEDFMERARGEKHLDLLVGLPGSTLEDIQESYDAAFALRPQELQLGFLKVLPGTPLGERSGPLGLIHSSSPPYEILSTPHLSFAQIKRLKQMERLMEIYSFDTIPFTLTYLLIARAPFALYEELAEQLEEDLWAVSFARRLYALDDYFQQSDLREFLELDYQRKQRSPRALFYPERIQGFDKGKLLLQSHFNGQELQKELLTLRIDQTTSRIDFRDGGAS